MKIALCLYGGVGGWGGSFGMGQYIDPIIGYLSYENILLSKYDVDVFIHSWSDDLKYEILNIYKPKKYKIEKQKDFSNLQLLKHDLRKNTLTYLPWWKLLSAKKTKTIDHIRENTIAGHSRWYSNKVSISLKKMYEDENNFQYDFVLLSRFDLIFFSGFNFEGFNPDYFYASPRPPWTEPFYLKGKALQDMWFLSNSNLMDKFSTLYDNIYSYSMRPPFAAYQHINTFTDKVKYIKHIVGDYDLVRNINKKTIKARLPEIKNIHSLIPDECCIDRIRKKTFRYKIRSLIGNGLRGLSVETLNKLKSSDIIPNKLKRLVDEIAKDKLCTMD